MNLWTHKPINKSYYRLITNTGTGLKVSWIYINIINYIYIKV